MCPCCSSFKRFLGICTGRGTNEVPQSLKDWSVKQPCFFFGILKSWPIAQSPWPIAFSRRSFTSLKSQFWDILLWGSHGKPARNEGFYMILVVPAKRWFCWCFPFCCFFPKETMLWRSSLGSLQDRAASRTLRRGWEIGTTRPGRWGTGRVAPSFSEHCRDMITSFMTFF